MTQEETNTEIIRKIYGDFIRGNYEAVKHAFADEIEWDGEVHWPGGPSLPYTGPRKGRKEVMENFATFLDVVKYEKQIEKATLIAKGNRVVAIGSDLRRYLKTDQLTVNKWTMIWTLKDGKVVKFRIKEDTVEQLD